MTKSTEDKGYNFESYKKDSLTRPRDIAWSNWAKFEKVGDKVQGYVRDAFFRPAQGIYKDQRGITLQQVDGTYINVAVKMIDFVLAPTNDVHIDDPLTVELGELRANDLGSPTKIYKNYSPKLSENAEKPTIKELTDKDMKEGGTVAPNDDKGGLDAFDEVKPEGVPFP